MSLRRVGVRLLPWRPRWRTGRPGRWDPGLPDIPVGDDPISAVVGLVLLVLLLPVVVVVVLGVIVFGVELSLLLLLLPLAWAGQVLAPCCGVAGNCARLCFGLHDRRRSGCGGRSGPTLVPMRSGLTVTRPPADR